MTDYLAIKEDLSKIIKGDVLNEGIDLERVSYDTSIFTLKPELLVYPKSEEDISELLKYVNKKKVDGFDISVAFRSAGTCMTGGPLSNSIVVDTTKYLNKIISVDEVSGVVEPGVYYRDFEKETLKHGWLMPSYPASRDLAAMGGIISNNSGGEKTLMYGKTEKYIKSLNVVYANGEKDTLKELNKEELENKIKENTESGRIHKEIFNLINSNYDFINSKKPNVSKNSSGYYLWNVYDKERETFDLSKLVVGSQGTLSFVTSSEITGIKPSKNKKMLVVFIKSLKEIGDIVVALLKYKPESIESYDDHTFNIAIKFFFDIAKKLGGNMIKLAFSFIPEFFLVLTGGVPKIILIAEFTGDDIEEINERLNNAYKELNVFDVKLRVVDTDDEAKKYWTFRRESFNLLRRKLKGRRTVPTIDDIVVHPMDLPTFLKELDEILSQEKYKDLVYTVAGHMGDANFHIIPIVDMKKDGMKETLHILMDEVYTLVFKYNGSMSGEHNDGLLRTPYLNKMFGEDMVKLFEKTKDIFDPNHILNPMKKVYGDKNFAWEHVDIK